MPSDTENISNNLGKKIIKGFLKTLSLIPEEFRFYYAVVFLIETCSCFFVYRVLSLNTLGLIFGTFAFTVSQVVSAYIIRFGHKERKYKYKLEKMKILISFPPVDPDTEPEPQSDPPGLRHKRAKRTQLKNSIPLGYLNEKRDVEESEETHDISHFDHDNFHVRKKDIHFVDNKKIFDKKTFFLNNLKHKLMTTCLIFAGDFVGNGVASLVLPILRQRINKFLRIVAENANDNWLHPISDSERQPVILVRPDLDNGKNLQRGLSVSPYPLQEIQPGMRVNPDGLLHFQKIDRLSDIPFGISPSPLNIFGNLIDEISLDRVAFERDYAVIENKELIASNSGQQQVEPYKTINNGGLLPDRNSTIIFPQLN